MGDTGGVLPVDGADGAPPEAKDGGLCGTGISARLDAGMPANLLPGVDVGGPVFALCGVDAGECAATCGAFPGLDVGAFA